MAVGKHPAQELKGEKDPEQQVHHAQPGRVGDEAGGDEVADGGDVDGQQARLEGDRGRTMAVEQAPQPDPNPAQGTRSRAHPFYRLAVEAHGYLAGASHSLAGRAPPRTPRNLGIGPVICLPFLPSFASSGCMETPEPPGKPSLRWGRPTSMGLPARLLAVM